jgi:hypothetical protein
LNPVDIAFFFGDRISRSAESAGIARQGALSIPAA